LVLGILTDTMSLTRGATELDFATFEELLPLLDKELLGRLRWSDISPDTLDTLARAIIHMDTSEAERLPGVRAILTGRRYPSKFGIYVQDKEMLDQEKVHHAGEPVAVAAVNVSQLYPCKTPIHQRKMNNTYINT
jgi:xanthine dehydrogenase molybdopterin-binding subunit B